MSSDSYPRFLRAPPSRHRACSEANQISGRSDTASNHDTSARPTQGSRCERTRVLERLPGDPQCDDGQGDDDQVLSEVTLDREARRADEEEFIPTEDDHRWKWGELRLISTGLQDAQRLLIVLECSRIRYHK